MVAVGLVSTIGMHCFTWDVEFPKFQTGIFVEWKAPFISKEGFQMPQAQDNDREEGLSPALARTALGPSDVDSRRHLSVDSKDQQLRHISDGGMFQSSVAHLFRNSLSETIQYFWITLNMQFEFIWHICVLNDKFYFCCIQAFVFLFHSRNKRFLFIIAYSGNKKIVAVVELKKTNKNLVVVVLSNFAIELVTGFYAISTSRLACEQQTYFRLSLLFLRKITTLFFRGTEAMTGNTSAVCRLRVGKCVRNCSVCIEFNVENFFVKRLFWKQKNQKTKQKIYIYIYRGPPLIYISSRIYDQGPTHLKLAQLK